MQVKCQLYKLESKLEGKLERQENMQKSITTQAQKQELNATPAHNVEDKRYIRSKRMIYDAMVELIEQKGLDGFTVRDLTQHADLNRSTFYSHFKDKDELIRVCEDEFLAELAEIEARIATVSATELGLAYIGVQPLKVLVDLFDFLGERSEILHALLGPNGDMRFERKLLDTVCSTIVNRILDDKYTSNPTPLVRYYVAYFSNASLGVVRKWIETGKQESSEEMASVLMHLAFINPGDPITLEGE